MAKGKFEAFATMLAVFNSSTPASLLEFCTDSVYASGETCPGWAPSAGSGCCYDLAVVPNNCCEKTPYFFPLNLLRWLLIRKKKRVDTWDEFPNAPADLVGDLNYVYVPDELAGCQFYKYVQIKQSTLSSRCS